MEGTETQYDTGESAGGQRSWKVSEAEQPCIIVSLFFICKKESVTETWFMSQFPFNSFLFLK